MKINELKKILDECKYAPASVVQAADKLLDMKKTHNKWDVIEKIIEIWAATNPTDYKSYLINLQDVKETRKSTWVGNKEFTGVSRKDGSYIQYTVDVPMKVVYMIRALYPVDELPMDKEFFQKFVRRFPKFKISQVKG